MLNGSFVVKMGWLTDMIKNDGNKAGSNPRLLYSPLIPDICKISNNPLNSIIELYKGGEQNGQDLVI